MRSPEERAAQRTAIAAVLRDAAMADRERGKTDLAAHVEGLPGGTVRGLDRNTYAAFKQKLVSTLRRA